MAGALLAKALVFHQHLAGMHDSIKPLRLVCGPDVPNPQSAAPDAWNEILVRKPCECDILTHPIVIPAKAGIQGLGAACICQNQLDTALVQVNGKRQNGVNRIYDGVFTLE